MPNLVMMIMQGKRKISTKLCFRLAKVMKLHNREAQYFYHMVCFTDAKTIEEKNASFLRMLKIRQSLRLEKSEGLQYEYFSNWYNPAIRELVNHPKFGGNFKWLARKLSPSITTAQSKESIGLLEQLGLIIRKGKRYLRRNATISIEPEIDSFLKSNFHRSTALLAASS